MEVILTVQQMIWGGGYLVVVGVAVWLEHRLVSRLWHKHELSRRIMGIVTVMGLVIPLLVAGMLDWGTWLMIVSGFVIAGIIVGFSRIWEIAIDEEGKRRQLNERAKEIFQTED